MEDKSRHPTLTITDATIHNADLCQKLYSNQQNSKFTDFTIVVEGASLACHKMVLAASSPYFDAVVSNDMIEQQQSKVTLENITLHSMQVVLEYMYTGRLTVDFHHVKDVLYTADYLQIPTIKQWCEQYVVNELNANNCLGWVQVGTLYNLGFLVEQAEELMYKSIHRVVDSAEFMQLSLTEILDYFSYESFKVRNEELLLQACIDWIRFDKENRLEQASDLLKCTNPAKCSNEFLKQLAKTNNDIVSGDVQKIIGNVMFERSTQEDTSQSPLMDERKCIILIGGYCTHGANYMFFKPKICNNKQQWKKLASQPKYRTYASICAVNDGLLLTGGEGIDSKECYLYWIKYNAWNRVADMQQQRSKHSSLAFGKMAYVFGGCNCEETVPAFDVEKNEWGTVSPMLHAPGNAPIVAKNGICAYVILNTSNVNRPIVAKHGFYMQIYNIVKDSWTQGPRLPGTVMHTFGSCAVSYKDTIYLVGGESKLCLSYNTLTSSWTNLRTAPRVHQFGATVLIDKTIRIYGGSKDLTNKRYTDLVMEYNIEEDEWQTLSDVVCPENTRISHTSAFLTMESKAFDLL